MEKAQWSPINSEPPSANFSPAPKTKHTGLARLPISFSNRTPMRPKKNTTEPQKHIVDRPTPLNNLTSSGHRECVSASTSAMNRSDSSSPSMTISPEEHVSGRRVESKRHEMASNGRNPTSMPSSGTQTPKTDRQVSAAVMTKHLQSQKPGRIEKAKEFDQAFDIAPLGNDVIVSEKKSNAVRLSEPRHSSVKRSPGPRDTLVSFTEDFPTEPTIKSHENHAKTVQPSEIDEQSSSSSDDDAVNLPTGVRHTTEEAIEEAESTVIDEPDHIMTANSLPDDHPIEWLAEAKESYRHSLPPFVTKQKPGVRRMVELPLAKGQRQPEKVGVVYRLWDALHSFATIDRDGRRIIVKVFRGGSTPYRPWLGPKAGFSKKALAFAKQIKQYPRGSKSWATTQSKRLALPKGWALKEDDDNDDDYNPADRRRSVILRGRRSVNYDLNDEEEELDEEPDQREPYKMPETVHSRRSSIEGDNPTLNAPSDRPMDSNVSPTGPASTLINAVKKSLRLPKEQDVVHSPRKIKRRSIGGQGVTTDSGVTKRPRGTKRRKRKARFSDDSDNPIPHKRAKTNKAVPRSTASNNPEKPAPVVIHDSPALETQTLSPYKQAHTTLRIALVPYPQQSAIQRLRSCMAISTFFTTVIGVSGYRGDRDGIFGIAATFDCKSDEDPDRSMVIREEWQDSFDVFLETVDGAESWTEDGGKCAVSVRLLLMEG